MLNRKERAVMQIIFDKCRGVGNCLISVNDIKAVYPKRKPISDKELISIIHSLELDDYFELVYSERRGEEVMCINLHSKGLLVKRETVQFRRAVINRVLLASVSAVVTFIIGRILIYLFR